MYLGFSLVSHILCFSLFPLYYFRQASSMGRFVFVCVCIYRLICPYRLIVFLEFLFCVLRSVTFSDLVWNMARIREGFVFQVLSYASNGLHIFLLFLIITDMCVNFYYFGKLIKHIEDDVLDKYGEVNFGFDCVVISLVIRHFDHFCPKF